MSFQFSFESVLRVRLLREEREERLLQNLFREIEHVRQSIDSIDTEMVLIASTRLAQVSGAIEARDLHLHTSTVAALYECKREFQKQLERLEQLKDSQLCNYLKARRDRQTIGDLRVKSLTIYNASQAAAEQKMLDDNFNARRHRVVNF